MSTVQQPTKICGTMVVAGSKVVYCLDGRLFAYNFLACTGQFKKQEQKIESVVSRVRLIFCFSLQQQNIRNLDEHWCNF